MHAEPLSVSDFARAAVRHSIQALRVPSGTLTGDLSTLVRALSELDAALGDTQKRIRGVLGPGRAGDDRDHAG